MNDSNSNLRNTGPRLIEIGLISAGPLTSDEFTDIRTAGKQLLDELLILYPAFDWRLSRLHRPDIGEFSREESSHLLLQAADERDIHNWDFVLMVTSDDLIPRYYSRAMAALSRPLDAAVISLCRLSNESDIINQNTKAPIKSNLIRTHRIKTLMLHAIGHWAGLAPAKNIERLMHQPSEVLELDAMADFSEAEASRMNRFLAEVGDTRLEEQQLGQTGAIGFWSSALWINRQELREAVMAAKPWMFPKHLSRLTTAAVSTTALLMLTAEAWDLALAQSANSLILMFVVTLILTTLFIADRHHLFFKKRRARTEQQVVSQVSAILVVVIGLVTTWTCLTAFSWVVSSALYPQTLIATWAGSTDYEVTSSIAKSTMSVFCGSIGLLIGSLGASFEDQHFFRHVIFVDEEI